MTKKQLTYPEALEQLRKAYEQEKIQLTARISTLEVTVSQLTIKVKGQQGKIKSLEKKLMERSLELYAATEAIKKLGVDKD